MICECLEPANSARKSRFSSSIPFTIPLPLKEQQQNKSRYVNLICKLLFFLGCSCHESCYENMNCCFPDDDDDKRVSEDKFSPIECLYVQTGTPDETWSTTVPAYRIVSSSPTGGCISYKRSESPIRQGLLPTCGTEPIAPWSNLFPVYSQVDDKIYKNAECALCHNATNVIT